VGLIADLDTEARGKILFLCWGLIPGRLVILSAVRHYTDAVPQPSHHVLKTGITLPSYFQRSLTGIVENVNLSYLKAFIWYHQLSKIILLGLEVVSITITSCVEKIPHPKFTLRYI
jgi:hypothetical protein